MRGAIGLFLFCCLLTGAFLLLLLAGVFATAAFLAGAFCCYAFGAAFLVAAFGVDLAGGFNLLASAAMSSIMSNVRS